MCLCNSSPLSTYINFKLLFLFSNLNLFLQQQPCYQIGPFQQTPSWRWQKHLNWVSTRNMTVGSSCIRAAVNVTSFELSIFISATMWYDSNSDSIHTFPLTREYSYHLEYFGEVDNKHEKWFTQWPAEFNVLYVQTLQRWVWFRRVITYNLNNIKSW